MQLRQANIFKGILNVLFGDYNGIQVFIAPITILYWIDSGSLLSSATSLLSFRMHYLPLLAFLIILLFSFFMLIKIKLLYNCTNNEYLDLTIQFNVSVMALVLIGLVIYAVSTFLAYFYGIKGTVKSGLVLLFKLYTVLLILYHYLWNVVLTPFYQRQYGYPRAIKAFFSWARKNKLMLLRYILLTVLLVYFSIRIYQLILRFVLVPCIMSIGNSTGIFLLFKLYPFVSLGDIFINVSVLAGAFLISNLFFYPIIRSVQYLQNYFLPFGKVVRSADAQSA
ncbi:MAG: hypothetical protein BWY19_01193 [bacterium ADurb.Bin212]|nr:MAG: hypothetical protein BWY19_01193 [bacterium ADurb.Bin212]